MTAGDAGLAQNDTIRSMTRHRSIRRYRPDLVDDAVFNAILAAAQSAPSSSHKQAYSVIRVSDPEARRRLAVVADDQEWVEEAPLFLVWCADLHRVKAVLDVAGSPVEHDNIEEFIVATVDTALAAAHAFVAAESLGLGGVMIGGLRNDPATVTAILALPDLVYPVFGLCLGYPDEDPELKPRLPRRIILHEERYDPGVVAEGVAEYDAVMNRYYQARSDNRRVTTWTSEMARKFKEKQRPHMRAYLESQGFRFD